MEDRYQERSRRAEFPSAVPLLGLLPFLILAILFHESLLRLLLSDSVLTKRVIGLLPEARSNLLVAGAPLAVAFAVLQWSSPIRKAAGHRVAANAILVVLGLYVPLACLEIASGALAPGSRGETIFTRDPELDWRMRPNAEGVHRGARIRVNAKGLRGPEIPYERTGSPRILWLGDSVTFGSKLPSYSQTYPYLVAANLESGVPGLVVETINSGVPGYAIRQECRYLETEGIRYDPDLVVLGFVLNDVTEKYKLNGLGMPVIPEPLEEARNADSFLKRHSHFYNLLWERYKRLRFGRDVSAGAQHEDEERMNLLIHEPDRPEIRDAWNATFAEIRSVHDICRNHDLPLLLLMFPYGYQLAHLDSLDAPNRKLKEFTEAEGIPFLDLRPEMARAKKERPGLAAGFLIDNIHLTELGGKFVAGQIADRIRRERYLPGVPAMDNAGSSE